MRKEDEEEREREREEMRREGVVYILKREAGVETEGLTNGQDSPLETASRDVLVYKQMWKEREVEYI